MKAAFLVLKCLRLDDAAQALAQVRCAIAGRFRQDDREFLTSIAGEQLFLADAALEPGRQVGTVGKIQAFPGAYNVIPGKVTTSLGLRDLDAAKTKMLFEKILLEVQQIEKTTGTKFEFKQTNSTPPAPTDLRVRRVIEDLLREQNAPAPETNR